MVRLGVVSDSHQSRFWTERFLEVANRERFDAVFHLGDGESEARWLSRRLKMPMQFVAGNCDMFSKVGREVFASYEGHRILACHGHLHDVKWGLDQLSYYAGEHGADIVLYGHTHEAAVEYVGPVMMVNPGALMRGRYAVLTLDGKRVIPTLLEL
ncbi:MAG: metallophosphoesterase [Clostridia bacterium]|nr:metallophosphoesterase [Clostridia bacterium]